MGLSKVVRAMVTLTVLASVFGRRNFGKCPNHSNTGVNMIRSLTCKLNQLWDHGWAARTQHVRKVAKAPVIPRLGKFIQYRKQRICTFSCF